MSDDQHATDAAPRLTRVAIVAAVVVVAVVIVERAWVCDDAFISFRSIDNLVNGFGLRWNVDERVQVFTHPLWLLLQVPLYWLTRNVVLTTLSLSIVSSVAALLVGARAPRASPAWLAAAAVLPLAVATSVVGFATSGLENPLSYLLLALFFHVGVTRPRHSALWLSLLASLMALNRLDALLFAFPTLLWLLLAERSRTRVAELVLGSLPLVLWECFSVLYFGSLVPNTKYAKLPSNVASSWYVDSGWQYLRNLARHDVVSTAVLVAGIALTVGAAVVWLRSVRDQRRSPFPVLFGAGVVMYCAYVVRVGGDFMQGRFFSLPVFACVLLLWSELGRGSQRWHRGALAAAGLAVVVFLGLRFAVADAAWFVRPSRIADERSYYLAENSLRAFVGGQSITANAGARAGRALAAAAAALEAHDPTKRLVEVRLFVGTLGYYAGPDVILVEPIGLTDPLLARLGVLRPTSWRVGHGVRRIPDGYLAVRRGEPTASLPSPLDEYYRALRLVVSGPVLDSRRLATVLRFNLGRYDHLLEDYERANPWDFGDQ